jgi:hypothetical protein
MISVKYTATFGTVRWEKHLGLPDQLASTYLQSVVPAEWTANDRLRGLTYVVVTLDLEEARFQGGPPPLTFDVSGRLLLDTRTSTTAWGENSALVIYDWLTAEWGFGIDPADVDTASINAAANACDAVISLTVGPDTSSGATYTANGACTSDAPQEAVLEELAQSMAGLVTHTGGLWVVNAGAYTAPVLALTENLQAGAIEVVQAGAAYADIFNGVRGRMIEHGRAVESDFDPYSNSAYVTDDGDELWTDITLPWTDNRARARNLARIFTEQARESLVIRYPAQLHAWPLQVGDRVTVTSAEYGWSAKVFRVTDWQWSDQSAVLLTLQEDGASIYDLADAATADSLPNTGLPNPYAVPALTGMAAASGSAHVLRQGDGSFLPRVWVTWDAISSAYVTQGGRVEIRWRRVGVDAVDQWRSVGAGGGSTGEYLVGAGAGDQVIIAARAVNSLGASGVESIINHIVIGDTTAPANATGMAYDTVIGGMQVWWDDPTESDYAYSELRQGVSWAAGAELFIGRGNTTTWYPPSDASYTLWLVHYDRTGNASTPESLATTYVGIGGTAGGNSATVYLYQRTASATPPSTLPAATLTYTFATGALSGGSLGLWSQTIPGSGGAYLHVTLARAYSTSATFDIPPGAWAAAAMLSQDGAAGSDAKALTLTSTALAFTYSATNVETPASQTISVTAQLANLAGTAAFTCTRYDATGSSLGTVVMGGSGNTRTLTGTQFAATAYAVVGATLAGFTDQITVVRLRDGSGGITPTFDNSAHTLPAASDGTVSSYAGSGGKIQVYEGSTALTFHTTLAAGRFTIGTPVVSPALAITVGARSGSGTTLCTVAVHSAASAAQDVITITYPVTVRRADGTDVTFDIVQTLTKSRQGAAGASVAELNVYRRATSVPSAPSGGSFDFTTQVLTPPASWSVGVPSGTDPVYVARGVASTATPGATVTPIWSSAALAFSDGQAVDAIFKRSASQPSTPSPSVGVPVGWYGTVAEVPASGNAMWSSFGTRPGPTANWTWNAAVQVEGLDGEAGAPAVTAGANKLVLVVNTWADGVVKAGQLPTGTTAFVKLGGVDDTMNWSASAVASAGLTVSQAGATFNLTALSSSVDSGTITITGTRSGYDNVVVVVSVSKAKDAQVSAGPNLGLGNLQTGATKLFGSGSVTLSAKLEFRTDGSVYAIGAATGETTKTNKRGEWYSPLTGSVGNSYSVTFNDLSTPYPGGTRSKSEGAMTTTRYVQHSNTASGGTYSYDAAWAYTVTRNSDGATVSSGSIFSLLSREV